MNNCLIYNRLDDLTKKIDECFLILDPPKPSTKTGQKNTGHNPLTSENKDDKDETLDKALEKIEKIRTRSVNCY